MREIDRITGRISCNSWICSATLFYTDLYPPYGIPILISVPHHTILFMYIRTMHLFNISLHSADQEEGELERQQ